MDLEILVENVLNAATAGITIGSIYGLAKDLGLTIVADETYTPSLADATTLVQKIRSGRTSSSCNLPTWATTSSATSSRSAASRRARCRWSAAAGAGRCRSWRRRRARSTWRA